MDQASDVGARLDDALARVVETIRRMPPGQLRSARSGEKRSPVDAARTLARALASAAQGIEAAASASPPAWRDLPDVPALVVGDQLAVLTQDLRLAVSAAAPAEVWTPNGREPLSDVLAELLQVITKTSRAL